MVHEVISIIYPTAERVIIDTFFQKGSFARFFDKRVQSAIFSFKKVFQQDLPHML